MHDINRQC